MNAIVALFARRSASPGAGVGATPSSKLTIRRSQNQCLKNKTSTPATTVTSATT